MIKTILAQISPTLYKKDKNIEKIKKIVKESESDLAVFAELFLTGYKCMEHLPKLSENLNGKSVKTISKISAEYGTHIIFGMPEKSEKHRGLFYNSAVLVQPDGKNFSYRKIHLANFGPFVEKQYFTAGREIQLFETRIGRLGLVICYDIFFPELSKTYAIKVADIIICISASPSTTRPFFEKVLPARAIENTTFVLYSNLVGTELNMEFWGGCTAIGPRGDIIAKGECFKDGIVKADLDLKEIETARHLRPTIRDTRPEIAEILMRSV